MIYAYFGMAPALTYLPTRLNSKMVAGKLANYLNAMEALCEFQFDVRYAKGAVKDNQSFKYADFGNLVFSKEVKGGGNGEVNFSNFAAAFLGLNGLFAQEPFKKEDKHPFLFGVIDHNSAHHMSWPLAARALQHRASHEKRLVLNFDAHYDYGAAGSDNIHCSTWAVKLFEGCPAHHIPRLVTAYAAVGVLRAPTEVKTSGNFATSVLTNKSQDKVAKLLSNGTDTTKGADVSGLLDAIESQAGLKDEKYSVYITYDRDVSEVSCTPYKDGQHKPEHAQLAVVNVIKALAERGCELVGFDVCGLPNSDGATTVQGKGLNDSVELAFDDIKVFSKACADALG
ncbi:MAG: hypothetical protein JXB05_07920 [Myxococcaceae bacterium]|nr:hypothetical protein [Myxococcaceae bacterium]